MKYGSEPTMADVKKIAVIAGDGIGPEVVAEALKVLKKPRKYLATVLKRSMVYSVASQSMKRELRFRRKPWSFVKS